MERMRHSHPIFCAHETITRFSLEQGLWFESEEEARRSREWARRKSALLRWVRAQMALRLSDRERQCIEMYFFMGYSYRRIGEITGTNASSVFRAVARGLRRLRTAAAEDAAWRAYWDSRPRRLR
jgi:RNA polymerase sigma factor (sigma-70 family)